MDESTFRVSGPGKRAFVRRKRGTLQNAIKFVNTGVRVIVADITVSVGKL